MIKSFLWAWAIFLPIAALIHYYGPFSIGNGAIFISLPWQKLPDIAPVNVRHAADLPREPKRHTETVIIPETLNVSPVFDPSSRNYVTNTIYKCVASNGHVTLQSFPC